MGFNDITAQWLREKISQHGLKNKDFAELTGTSAADLSAMLSEAKPLSRVRKVGYWYFFLWLESEKNNRK